MALSLTNRGSTYVISGDGADDTRESMSSEVMRISESEGNSTFTSDGETGSTLSTSGSEFEVQTAISTLIHKSPSLVQRHESLKIQEFHTVVPVSPRRLSSASTASWLAHDSPHVDSSPDMKKLSLGPKVKIFGKAPWDTEDGEEEAMSKSVSNVTLQASSSGGAISKGSRGNSISSMSAMAIGAKGKENVRSSNRSPISTGPSSPPARRFVSLEKQDEEALTGLGIGNPLHATADRSNAYPKSEGGSPPFPSQSSHINLRRPSESTSPSPTHSPQLDIPKSAPPHFSHFSSAETSPPTPPTKNQPPLASSSVRSGRSLPSSPSLPPSPYEDPSSPGKSLIVNGRRIVSLEEGSQKGNDRLAKNRLPVGYLKEKLSMPSSATREQPSSESRSIRSAVSIKSVKSKKSGFLKRMMGGDRERTGASPPLPMELYEPPMESFRSLPDDYVHVASFPRPATPLALSSPPPPVPSSDFSRDTAGPYRSESKEGKTVQDSSRIAFLPPPPPIPESRPRKGLPPSLSLRPVSMAFSAGLPPNFLEQQSAKAALLVNANLPHQVTPPTRVVPSLPLQLPYAPSFKSTGTSSIFDQEIPGSATSSTFATPSSAVFSPLSSPTDIESPLRSSLATSNSDGLTVDMVERGFTSLSAVQEQFGAARRVWNSQQFDLESQIRNLTAEITALSAGKLTGSSSDPAGPRVSGISAPCAISD